MATDFESLAIASPSWCQLAEPDFEQTEAIPTMGAIGRLLFVGLLLIFGLTFFGRSQWARFEPDSARSRFLKPNPSVSAKLSRSNTRS